MSYTAFMYLFIVMIMPLNLCWVFWKPLQPILDQQVIFYRMERATIYIEAYMISRLQDILVLHMAGGRLGIYLQAYDLIYNTMKDGKVYHENRIS